MKILVINAGSSSLKYQLFDMSGDSVLAKGLCERIGAEGSRIKHYPAGKEAYISESAMNSHLDAIKLVLAALTDSAHGVIAGLNEISAVGHRVVHGGETFSGSVLIDENVKTVIADCSKLAPLHNPANLTGITACEEAMPGVPQVAVFDTAFHQTMPPEAFMYALPYELYEKHKIRKYGFHGTSHKCVAQKTAAMLNRPLEALKIITVHLGNGSSLTAVKNGKSVDTSMGFTPLAGVPMGTRSGVIDPAIIKFLSENEGMTANEIDEMLNKKSGVLGISGISSDFRDLTDAAKGGSDRAELALEKFAYSVRQYIGMYAVSMGGVDAVTITAGIGENDVGMRARIFKDMDFMGVAIDPKKNEAARGIDADISADGTKVRVLVASTDEELMIAMDTAALV